MAKENEEYLSCYCGCGANKCIEEIEEVKPPKENRPKGFIIREDFNKPNIK